MRRFSFGVWSEWRVNIPLKKRKVMKMRMKKLEIKKFYAKFCVVKKLFVSLRTRKNAGKDYNKLN